MLAGFVVLYRAEARLIKNYKNLYVIVHYYGVEKEKLSIITTIDVRANKRYAHINYDL